MTDRELLELAAKAAGMKVRAVGDGVPSGRVAFYAESDYLVWNPLTDDGDRYRLARQLTMIIDFYDEEVRWQFPGKSYWGTIPFQDVGGEARAVVMAAAEIGRAMG